MCMRTPMWKLLVLFVLGAIGMILTIELACMFGHVAALPPAFLAIWAIHWLGYLGGNTTNQEEMTNG